MSTLQTSPGTHSTRTSALVVALAAFIAIGVTVVILALTGANHATPPSAANHSNPAAASALPAPALPSYLRGPATHALTRIQTPRSNAGPAYLQPPYVAGP